MNYFLNRSILEAEYKLGIVKKLNDKIITDGKLSFKEFCAATMLLSPQKRFHLIKKEIIKLLDGFEPTNGDGRVLLNHIYYTIKITFSNENNTINLRQLRSWRNIERIIIVQVNDEDYNKTCIYDIGFNDLLSIFKDTIYQTHLSSNEINHNKYLELSITCPIDENNDRYKMMKKYELRGII